MGANSPLIDLPIVFGLGVGAGSQFLETDDDVSGVVTLDHDYARIVHGCDQPNRQTRADRSRIDTRHGIGHGSEHEERPDFRLDFR